MDSHDISLSGGAASSLALDQSGQAEAAAIAAHRRPVSQADLGPFISHLLQMMIAMWGGMMVYHLVFGPLVVPNGWVAVSAFPLAKYTGMELSMALPMGGLMLYRGHGWRRGVEMAVVMLAPPAIFVACLLVDAQAYLPWLSLRPLVPMADGAGMLAIVGLMFYRRKEYTAGHHHGGTPLTAGGQTAHDVHGTHECAPAEDAAAVAATADKQAS